MPIHKSTAATNRNVFQRGASAAASRPTSVNSGVPCCLACTPYTAQQRLDLYKFVKNDGGVCATVPDTQLSTDFGSRVVMSKDGRVLAVAAPLYDVTTTSSSSSSGKSVTTVDNGAVYVYERANSHGLCGSDNFQRAKWTLRQRLVQATPKTCTKELQSLATPAMFNFGQSIALSEDGFYIVIGAPLQDDDPSVPASGDGGGAVYVYARCPKKKSYWVPVDKLTAKRTVSKTDEWECTTCVTEDDAEAGDLFGFDVDISRDGGTILVGAPGKNNMEGAAYIYRRNCTIGEPNATATFQRRCSTQALYSFVQKLTRDGPAQVGGMFGFNVALSEFGDLAAIGKPSLDANLTFPSTGAVCIFESGSPYKFIEEVTPVILPDDLQKDSFFGTGVRLTPDKRFLFVEAPGENKPVQFKGVSVVQRVGSVYAFERQCKAVTDPITSVTTVKKTYVQVAKICPDFSGTDIVSVVNDTMQLTSFDINDNGCVVAVGYETLLDGQSFNSSLEGAVVVFRFDKKTHEWEQSEIVRPFNAKTRKDDPSRDEAGFGASVTVSGDSQSMVVGEAASIENVSALRRDTSFAYSYSSKCGLFAPSKSSSASASSSSKHHATSGGSRISKQSKGKGKGKGKGKRCSSCQ